MIRSTNKKELLDFSKKYFQEIIDLVKELPDEIKNMEFLNNEINERDKTVSDVICHLHEWYEREIPRMPMGGYNWKQLTAVNEITLENFLIQTCLHYQWSLKTLKRLNKFIKDKVRSNFTQHTQCARAPFFLNAFH